MLSQVPLSSFLRHRKVHNIFKTTRQTVKYSIRVKGSYLTLLDTCGSRASCESPGALSTVGTPIKCCAAKRLVRVSTAELSETLVGVFLPGPQARLAAGSDITTYPRKLRSWGLFRELVR